MIIFDPNLLTDPNFDLWQSGFIALCTSGKATKANNEIPKGKDTTFFKHPSTELPHDFSGLCIHCVAQSGYAKVIQESAHYPNSAILSDRLPDELPQDIDYTILEKLSGAYHFLGPYLTTDRANKKSKKPVLLIYNSLEVIPSIKDSTAKDTPIEEAIIPNFDLKDIINSLNKLNTVDCFDLAYQNLKDLPEAKAMVVCLRDPQTTLFIALQASIQGAAISYCLHPSSSPVRYNIYKIDYPSLDKNLNFMEQASLKSLGKLLSDAIKPLLKPTKIEPQTTPEACNELWMAAFEQTTKIGLPTLPNIYDKTLYANIQNWEPVKKLPSTLPLAEWINSKIAHRVIARSLNNKGMLNSKTKDSCAQLLQLKLHAYKLNNDFSPAFTEAFKRDNDWAEQSLKTANENTLAGLHPESAYANHAEMIIACTMDNLVFPHATRNRLLQKAYTPMQILLEEGGYSKRALNLAATLLFGLGDKDKALAAIQAIYKEEDEAPGLLTKSVLKLIEQRYCLLSGEDKNETQSLLGNAVELFEQEIKLDKAIDATLLSLPTYCAVLGDSDRCLKYTSAALAKYPKTCYLYSKVAFWLWMHGYEKASIDMLKEERCTAQEDPIGILTQVLSQLFHGQIEKAVSFLKEKQTYLQQEADFLAKRPYHWLFHALLFTIAQNKEEAERCYNKALEIDPLYSTFKRSWSNLTFPKSQEIEFYLNTFSAPTLSV